MFIFVPDVDPVGYDNRRLAIKDNCACTLVPWVPSGAWFGSSPRKAAYAFYK